MLVKYNVKMSEKNRLKINKKTILTQSQITQKSIESLAAISTHLRKVHYIKLNSTCN